MNDQYPSLEQPDPRPVVPTVTTASNMPIHDRTQPHVVLAERVVQLEHQLSTAIAAKVAAEQRIKTINMCELGAENPEAMEYMKHWEQRAEKAERDLADERASKTAREKAAEQRAEKAEKACAAYRTLLEEVAAYDTGEADCIGKDARLLLQSETAGSDYVHKSRLDEAVKALKQIEWQGEIDGEPFCPWCGKLQWQGHGAGCKVAEILAAEKVIAANKETKP